jgi:glycosyltransferase involved in cell wall biosynthesis
VSLLPPLVLLLPEGSARVSGGNIYNAELWRELSLATTARAVDRATFRALLTGGTPGVYFVDSLDLDEALRLPERAAGQRAILLVHHLPSLEPEPNNAALALERAALPLFDAYLCTSPFTREWLRGRGIDPGRLMLVTPGLPAIEPVPEGDARPLCALMVGNLIARKGVLPLLEALAREVRPDDAFTLELLGRSDLEPEYAAACRSVHARSPLGERVRFLAEVPYGEMGAVYRRASLVVSAASMETYGMALAEARAHGVPMLTRDGGYARHHVNDGKNGHIVSSVGALAHALLGFARDPGALGALRTGARALASPGGPSWARAAAELTSALERLERGG